MLKQSLKGVKYLLRGGHLLRISVFDWDKSTGQVIITKNKLTWLCLILITLYLSGQSVFEVYQLYRLAGDPSEPYSNYMKLLMQFLTRSAALIIQVNTMVAGGRKAMLMNMTIELNKRFKEVRGGSELKDPMKILIVVCLFLSFVNPAFTALDFVETRTQSRYWHHLVIPPAVFPFTVPFLAVLEYFITAAGIQNCIWYLYLVTAYFRASRTWMNLVMKVENVSGGEWNENGLLLFRTMQVYNQVYNNTMARLWAFQVGVAFLIETMAIVLSLKLAPSMPFPTNLMFPSAAVGLIWYTTTVYKVTTAACDSSEEMARKLKISADKYKRVIGASMKPLRVEVRPFFYMEKTTSFSFTNQVTDNTISILLATS